MNNARLLHCINSAGWALLADAAPMSVIEELSEEAFGFDGAGRRCLLDRPEVARAAHVIRTKLESAGVLAAGSPAIQAIAFDKTPAANWKVAWHQDLQFPFSRRVTAPGFVPNNAKDGVDYARPPLEVLSGLLAVRLHLDECGDANGPLRISPGSHSRGVIPVGEISKVVAECGHEVCIAQVGDAVLMRPLALHASSPAIKPGHRRVVHFVYYGGPVIPEPWHRTI